MRTALIAAAIALSTIAAQPAAAADPSGDWMVENGSAIIRIAKCGDLYWGVVAWEREPGRDSANPELGPAPDPSLDASIPNWVSRAPMLLSKFPSTFLATPLPDLAH